MILLVVKSLILKLPPCDVDDFCKKECPSSGSSEASTYKFGTVCEESVTRRTREQPSTTKVLQKYSPHTLLEGINDTFIH